MELYIQNTKIRISIQLFINSPMSLLIHGYVFSLKFMNTKVLCHLIKWCKIGQISIDVSSRLILGNWVSFQLTISNNFVWNCTSILHKIFRVPIKHFSPTISSHSFFIFCCIHNIKIESFSTRLILPSWLYKL